MPPERSLRSLRERVTLLLALDPILKEAP